MTRNLCDLSGIDIILELEKSHVVSLLRQSNRPYNRAYYNTILCHIDGLEQDCSISSALAMKMQESCNESSI